MSLAETRIYEEIVDFIAGTSPSDVVAFLPSESAKQIVEDLIARDKAGTLTPEELSELAHYQQLEHLMRLAKARARQHLAHG